MDNLIVKSASFYKLCSILDPMLEKIATGNQEQLANANNTNKTAVSAVKGDLNDADVVMPVTNNADVVNTVPNATTGAQTK